MATFGWKLGSPSESNNNVIATTQSVGSHDPGQSTPVVDTPAAQTGLVQAPVATGNPGNVPGQPPGPGYHWQGGAPNPNGPVDPHSGGRYVDPTYTHDATGQVLTPEQQAYWRQYDTNRAQAGSIARSNNVGGSSSTSNPNLAGLDYDPNTRQWQYYDTKTKGWQTGKSVGDIYNTLFTDQERAQHPLFYYQNQAATNDYEQLRHQQFTMQSVEDRALQGTPTTRYTPVRF
jgi:hypothetical protein